VPDTQPKSTYARAGVDIDRATSALARLAPLAARTHGPNVLTGLGLFAGFYRLPTERYARPVLVASVDGVGTKLALATTAETQSGVGADLVAHCVNDIAVHGADPVFFLDYFAQGRLNPETLVAVVDGMSRACLEAGCALIGGETAEMPGLYRGEDFDLAGSIVGIVDEDRILRGDGIAPGDVLVGLASEGLHTNGYSLARAVLLADDATRRRAAERLGSAPEAALLAPHRMYLAALRTARDVAGLRGAAHITGGGLVDNLPRILPEGTAVAIDRASWTPPRLFDVIREMGAVPDDEMFRTFNMGVGMVLIASPEAADTVLRAVRAAGETAWVVGSVERGDRRVRIA
jgi:phosphoribosylformylglycinamidine cyclo-ligase